MRRATVLAAFVSPAAWLAANLAVHPARAQNFDFTGHPPVRANSPGLECRQTRHPLYALDAPSPAARRVAVISAFVAVAKKPGGSAFQVVLTHLLPLFGMFQSHGFFRIFVVNGIFVGIATIHTNQAVEH